MSRAHKPVVIITGVSSGIGMATAKLFASRGWIVVGTVRGRAKTGVLKSWRLDLQPAEMVRPGDLERVMMTAWRTYGRLDALVCNAGYGLLGPIDSLEYPQMLEQLSVNVLAPAELIRHAVPLMRGQGSGVIVGLSSMVGQIGLPGYSMYAASKFALEGLFESLALELEPDGIRVKLIEPSGVNTAFWASIRRGSRRRWNDREPGGQLAEEEMRRSHHGLSADAVAASILAAVTDGKPRLRYRLGQTRAATLAKRLLPEPLYRRILRRVMMKFD